MFGTQSADLTLNLKKKKLDILKFTVIVIARQNYFFFVGSEWWECCLHHAPVADKTVVTSVLCDQ